MNPFFSGILLAVGALAMFSANILLTKAASKRVNLNLGFLVSVSVNLLFCGLLFGIQLLVSDKGVRWDTYAIGIFILAGIFSTYLGRWFLFEAVVRFGSAKASVFQVSSPGFAAMLAWLFLAEPLSALAIIGILITISGLVIVSYIPNIRTSSDSPDPNYFSNGVSAASLAGLVMRSSLLLGLASSLAYAVGTVLRGTGIKAWNEPVLGALLGAASGLLLHTITSSEIRNLRAVVKTADPKGILLYAIIGMVTISAQICSIWSMRYIPIALSNLITQCTPLLVIPGSYFLFRNAEGMTYRTWMGAALTITGIAMVLLGR